MANPEYIISKDARDKFTKVNSKECRAIADAGYEEGNNYILPISAIVKALNSIQDTSLQDECAKAIDGQKTTADLLTMLRAQLGNQGSTQKPTPTPPPVPQIAGLDRSKVHLQLAKDKFQEVNQNSSVQEILMAYQKNYGLLVAKEREYWIQHIDDQAPAISLDFNWQGMKLHNPIVRTNQYEHIGRQALSIGNEVGLAPFTGISNESSGDNILNYSHSDGMKILSDIASQYDKAGQNYIMINGQKIGGNLSDSDRQQLIKRILIDANEAVKAEADTNLMISTAFGIPMGLLMLYSTLRGVEKILNIGSKEGRLIAKPFGFGADQTKAKYEALMTYVKSSNMTWDKARDLAKARLSRAKEAVQNPTINEELKKSQLEDIKDPIRDILWSEYSSELQRSRPGYTSDNFASDLKEGRELPVKSLSIRTKMRELGEKVGKYLPIDPSADPLERELRIREVEKVLPSSSLDKFYRKVFEGGNPLGFLSNNRGWSLSEALGKGSESPEAKAAREEFTRALSKIDAEIGSGIDGDKIQMRLPQGAVDAAKGVKSHIDATAFQSAVLAEGKNEGKVRRSQIVLDADKLSDITSKTPEEIKKLQKMYSLALVNNERTKYNDLKDKRDLAKQVLDDATVEKDKYKDGEKDLIDLNSKRKLLEAAEKKFEGEKLDAAKMALRSMQGILGGHTQANGQAFRTQLLSQINDAVVTGDKYTIEGKVLGIKNLVTQYDNAQSDDSKKIGSFVDTAEGVIREMGQVGTHASLDETKKAVTDAKAKFDIHNFSQGENTDFRTENRSLENVFKNAEKAHDTAKKKFEAISEEVRNLLETKTDDELKQEKARIDRVIRAQETKAKSEIERTNLRQNVERTAVRAGVDADNFKRGDKGSLPDAGRSQLADFQRFTSDPANDFHRIVTDAHARGYEIRQEGKKVIIVDTSKPGEAPKTYDTTSKIQETAMYEHLAKLKIITARVR